MSTENKQGYKRGFWKDHSEAWKSSGLTQIAYCAEHGIGYKSFVYQHNRMASKSKQTPIKFIEAKQESIAVTSQVAGLQLMLPNGIRVGIGNDVTATLLQTVLSIAGAMRC